MKCVTLMNFTFVMLSTYVGGNITPSTMGNTKVRCTILASCEYSIVNVASIKCYQ